MSIHSSLKTGSGMNKHRNVLTRTERLAFLEGEGKWEEAENSVLGLPKVRSIKIVAKKKAKEDKGEEKEGEDKG